VWIFAPVPAVMYKSHNRFRGQMLISSQQRNKLHDYLRRLENELNELKGVSVAIDVDPLEV
jgi:primosomal protein N'